MGTSTPIGLIASDPASGEFKSEFRSRKRAQLLLKVHPDELESYQAKGYSIKKTFSRHIELVKDKEHSVLLEDRVWFLFMKMGFAYLNPYSFTIPVESAPGSQRNKQIDVLARDGKEIVIVECKSSETKDSRTLRAEINEFANLRISIEKWAKDQFGGDCRITFLLCLWNLNLSENDESDAKGFNIYVWKNEDLQYFERLADLIGNSAKYQFLASLFGDEEFPGELEPVPAFWGTVGGRKFYVFCETPASLLKVSYVHHRFAHKKGENAYQRMLDKAKLKKIDRFIDDGGFFANNIIVNLTRSPSFLDTACVHGVHMGYIRLANRYASAWIVDGQHRLYGYANNPRKETDLLPVLAFEDMNDEEQGKLFVDINKNQKAVEANLLWDLYSEIFEHSEDRSKQKLRSLSLIAKRLNLGQSSPFKDVIYIPSHNVKSSQVNITIETVCTAMKKNRILAEDMLFRTDYDTSVNFATERISEFFSFIKERLPDDWKKGKDGFSASNNGVAPLFIILRECVKYANFRDRKLVESRPKWKEIVAQVVEPCMSYIESMTDEQRDDLRSRASSEGQRPKIAKELAHAIQLKFPDFAPGLAVEKEPEETEKETDEDLVGNAELSMRHFVRDRLSRAYADNWYTQGIPPDVKEKIEQKKQKDIAKHPYRRVEFESRPALLLDYTDIVDLGRIITWGSNWHLFKETFQNEEETRRHVEDFQTYRNIVFHLRERDEVAVKSGKASIAWIQKCISTAS